MEAIEPRMLKTRRLVLRAVEPGDEALIVEYLGDYEVAKMLATVPHPFTGAHFADFVRRLGEARDTLLAFAIQERHLVGTVGLSKIHAGHGGRIGTLGYWIARPFWGRGFAGEAAGALVEHAFGALGFAMLKSGHFKDNPASGRVLAKLGFRTVGEHKHASLARGEEVPHVDVELRRVEWAERAARRRAFAANGKAG